MKLNRKRNLLLMGALLCLCQLATAARLALVIGNDRYERVTPLRNAAADATTMAEALQRVGFQTQLVRDASQRGMRDALSRFAATLAEGDDVVVFYAGHGVQLAGQNHLLPVDVPGEGEQRVMQSSLPLQDVLDALQKSRVRFALLVIDACRDNPFGSGLPSALARGLVPTAVATGQMIIYSAGSGQQALDSLGAADRSPNGVFTRVFVDEMLQSDLPVDRLLRRVRDDVVKLARGVGHEQVPSLYDQSLGDFFFRRGSGPARHGTVAAGSAPIAIELVMGTGDGAVLSEQAQVLASDLERSGRFRLLTALQGRDAVPTRGLAREPQTAQRVSVNLAQVTDADGRIDLQARVYERPSGRWLGGISQRSNVADRRLSAHRTADWLLQRLDGTQGRFGLRQAKVTTRPDRMMLVISDSDGADPQTAVSSPRALALPTWSADRGHLAYVSYEQQQARVYVQQLSSGVRTVSSRSSEILSACSTELARVQATGTPAGPEFWLRDDWQDSGTAGCAAAFSAALARSDELPAR
ncbi:caspase family protein [Roseateles sp. LYH14W]|uniref:Caspase family protein n=1 Tax=Pelomonas parva TaxID=3299032 RepID=A0ABW7F6N5_9BURK